MLDLNPTVRNEESEQTSQEIAESASISGTEFTPKMPVQPVFRPQGVLESSVGRPGLAASKPVVQERAMASIDLSSTLNLDNMSNPHTADTWEAILSSVK